MGKATGSSGRVAVTGKGIKPGDVVVPVRGGPSAIEVTRVEKGIVYGRAVGARVGTMGAREAQAGSRQTRYYRYPKKLTGDRYNDLLDIGRFFSGRLG